MQRCPIFVALHPDKNEFPVDSLGDLDINFISLKNDTNQHRFPHAKIILAETEKFDHVLFGSANCSDDALGGMRKAARNAETSVYRRLPADTLRIALELDLQKKLDIKNIRHQSRSLEHHSQTVSLPAGYIEYQEKMLIWSPADGIDGNDAQMVFADLALPLKALPNQKFGLFLNEPPLFPLIAYLILKDGRKTDPVIVHDKSALRRASPGNINPRLRQAFDRIESGEEDLIDLAREAHLLFSTENPTTGKSSSARSENKKSTQSEDQQFDTPEDFRKALSQKPATGERTIPIRRNNNEPFGRIPIQKTGKSRHNASIADGTFKENIYQ